VRDEAKAFVTQHHGYRGRGDDVVGLGCISVGNACQGVSGVNVLYHQASFNGLPVLVNLQGVLG
jgi:hypothetical protein